MPTRSALAGSGSVSPALITLLLAMVFLVCSPPAFATDNTITRTLFAPETFTRSQGTSFSRTFTVPSTQGSFNLHVVNGDGAGHHNVSSATIKVNGATVVKSSDLSQQVNSLDKALTNLVKGSNTLTVSITSNSSPSSYLTVSTTGTYLLDVRITNPADGTLEPNDHVAVQGTYASYTSNFTINVNAVSASASNGAFTASSVPLSGGSNYVTATIATVDGLSDTYTISLTLNRPPVAEAGLNRNVTAGYGVTLDGRNSYDPEGALITYRWNFASRPTGSTSSLINSTSVNPSFVPDLPGSYVVSLVVNDGVQDSLPDNVTVIVAANSPPTANAGPDQSVTTGFLVQLDGRGSFDPEGAPLLYSWSFLARPPGSGANLNADNSTMPTFTADLDGTYTVELTVSDGQLTGLPDNVSVVAATPNAPPVAYAGMDLTAYRNTTVLLDGTQSSDPDNDVLTYWWSIVSKPQGSTSELDNTSAARPSLHLDMEGDFVLRLVVNDGHVDSAPDTVVIISVNAVPVAEAGPDQVVSTATSVTLDGSGSTDANGDPLTFAWSIISAPAGSAASLSDPSASRPTFVPDLGGQYVIRLVVSDGWVTSAPDNVTVTAWPPIVAVPSVLGMTQAQAQNMLVAAGLTVGNVTNGYSDTVAAGRVMSQYPGYGSTANRQFPVDFVVSVGPIPLPLPPNPATVAPPVSSTVATTVVGSTVFLYTGTDPIQRDVAPGTIEAKRGAVIRGAVRTRDGAPLPGVAITVLNHPEFGRTLTRVDGMFDMVVNGGGLLKVQYSMPGYPTVQRQMDVPWQDFAPLPDVVLVPYDNQVTVVNTASSEPFQLARSNAVSDASGARQATLLFPQGTQAQMSMPDGSTRPVTTLNVRATEFTVGATGPNAMPAPLPPATGYTYCVDLSVDEAVATGADNVTFDRPVFFYVENFLSFPAGMIVPVGYYDRKRGVWVPSKNGLVVKILSITGGLADLDTNGDGQPDTAAQLASLGITDAERQKLANNYSSGQSLWRVPVTHFTQYDCNMPTGLPDDSTGPIVPNPKTDPTVTKGGDCRPGSIIDCQNQTLGETFPATGTPFTLNYRSDRVPGRMTAVTATIPLSGDTVPPSLKRIDLEVVIAGRFFTSSYPPVANENTVFTWDGMDVYGRTVQGIQSATIRIGYVYDSLYRWPAGWTEWSFAIPGEGFVEGIPARQEVTIWKNSTLGLGTWDARSEGLGGWSLSVHHSYDPIGRVLYRGDGGRQEGTWDSSRIIRTAMSGILYPFGMAVAPDGSLYVSDLQRSQIFRLKDGVLSLVAGVPWDSQFGGDGGPATEAGLSPAGLAVGADNSLYVADYWNNRVRRIRPDGIIETVAGTGETGFGGDGGPATAAKLYFPLSVALGSDGALHIVDSAYGRIRRVGTDGIITTIAGGGGETMRDGAPANQVEMSAAMGIAVGADGTVYVSGGNYIGVRRITADGRIFTVPGVGASIALAISKAGTLFVADLNRQILRVDTDGTVSVIAGGGSGVEEGGPALNAQFYPQVVTIGPDDRLYIGSMGRRVDVIEPLLPGFEDTSIAIPSEDGRELYYFDSVGRHLQTMNVLTGTERYRFAYDGEGRLVQVIASDNNITNIERNGAGVPTAIVAPGGQRTGLSLDSDGFLSLIVNPAGDNVQLTYKTNGPGLLDHLVDWRGGLHRFTYDDGGRLIRDDDPAFGFKILQRAVNREDSSPGGGDFTVTVNTALNRATRHEVTDYPGGARRLTTTYPAGPWEDRTIYLGGSSYSTGDGSYNTHADVTEGPDSRFGMLAPVGKTMRILTPWALDFNSTSDRTVQLAPDGDPLHLVSQTDTTTINGRTYTNIFDGTTLRNTSTTPAGRSTVMYVDNQLRPLTIQTDSSILPLDFRYDSRGRLAQTGQDNNLWTYIYDNSNRLWYVTDPMNHTTEYGYDSADRVNMVKMPSGRTYGFGYDRGGNRTKVIMPNLAEHGLGYTPVNLDNSYTPPASPPYSRYYSLDQEWMRTDFPGGWSMVAGYDNAGRLQEIGKTICSGGDCLPLQEGTSYGYAEYNNWFSRIDKWRNSPQGGVDILQSLNYDYDGFLTTKVAFSGVATGEYRYVYDNNFWVKGIALDNVWLPLNRDDDGLPTQFGPFTIGRGGPAGALDNVSDLVPVACGTDNSGLPVPCVGGDMAQYYGYDNTGRLNRRTQTVNGTPVYEVVLDRDPAGRIVRKVETSGIATSTFDYGYDVDGQLNEVRRNGVLSEQYGYDNNANRNVVVTQNPSRTLTAGDFDYDLQDRLGRMGTISYVFNADGYLANRGLDNIIYSARGELLQATIGTQTITYQYDGTGRRVARTDTTGTTQYLYGNLSNPFQVTASRASDNVLTVYYYDDYNALYAMERGGVRYYVGSDHLGTPKVITDNTGVIVRQVEYDSWGVKISDTNPSFDLPVGFAGGIPDDATGLVRFGFRDYEPGTGRWAAKDPIFFYSGQYNLYGYAFNDPINWQDKTGSEPRKPVGSSGPGSDKKPPVITNPPKPPPFNPNDVVPNWKPNGYGIVGPLPGAGGEGSGLGCMCYWKREGFIFKSTGGSCPSISDPKNNSTTTPGFLDDVGEGCNCNPPR